MGHMRIVSAIKRILNSRSSTNNLPTNLVSVGFGSYGSENLIVHSWDQSTKCNIGKYCSIADNVNLYLGGNHNTNLISTYPFGTSNELIGHRPGHPLSNGDINVGNDVWIGSHASIMSGVTIGDGAVIAAHSHVVKDVRPYEIVGGNPAQHIRFRFTTDLIERLVQVRWWNLPESEVHKYRDLLTTIPNKDLLEKFEQDIVKHRDENIYGID